jgi:hypothetical protein
MSELASCGHRDIGARVVCEKKIFQGWPRLPLKSLPFSHRNEHSGIRAAFRNGLRTFSQTGIQQLAKPRLGVLDGPATHELFSSSSQVTSLATQSLQGRWPGLPAFTFLLPAVTCVL